MRLSAWRLKAPGKDGLNPRIIESVGMILTALGTDADPHGWLTWADETGSRWAFMAPCEAGLAVVNVRAGLPTEGPRAGGRLVRWTKVQIGELAVETERGHRLVMFQVEGQPIRGTDDQADDVAEFASLVLAGVDGRKLPDLDGPGAGSAKAASTGAKPGAKSGAKSAGGSAAKPPAAPAARPSARPAAGSTPSANLPARRTETG